MYTVLYFNLSSRTRVCYESVPRGNFLDFVPGAEQFARYYMFYSI